MKAFPHGFLLDYGDNTKANTPTYANVGDLKTITGGLGLSVEEVDVTGHGNTDQVREYIAGLAERKPITVTVQATYGDTAIRAMDSIDFARTVRAWKITHPILTSGNTTKATSIFNGFITDISPSDVDGGSAQEMQYTLTIRPTSDVDYTAEAA